MAEIDDLRDRATRAGVTLFTAWHAQHNPAVAEAAKLLRGEDVQSMIINWHEDVEKWHPGQKWIWQAKGFGVFDPGINAFSIASLVFPGGLLVEEAELQFPSGSDTPIAAHIRFGSANGSGNLRCSLDWRKSAGEEWTISFVTKSDAEVMLLDGGERLLIDGVEVDTPGDGEYADIYRRFSALIKSGQSEIDTVPLRMVSDCLLVGSRRSV
jgi:predicted dehydrogenase